MQAFYNPGDGLPSVAMPLPPLIRRLLDTKIGAWCDDRVPEHIRDQLRYEHGIRGSAATIFEVRPIWDGSPGETRGKVAQIRFDGEVFALYNSDRNGKWHFFEPFEPTKDLDAVLSRIGRDETGIFFG